MHMMAAETRDPNDPPPVLTRRERELVGTIRRGLSNRRIAEEFHVAEQTVKNRLSKLYAKLHVKNRIQLLLKTRHVE